MVSIVWFQNDLRLSDHPALVAGIEAGGPVIPIYIDDEEPREGLRRGAASRWWLSQSLEALDAALRVRGSRLTLRRGDPAAALMAAADECGAQRVYTIGAPQPAERDVAIRTALAMHGVELQTVGSHFLVDPSIVHSGKGRPYRIFSSFEGPSRRAIRASGSTPAPSTISAPSRWPTRVALGRLMPRNSTHTNLAARWTPGEESALARLRSFVQDMDSYAENRDRPDIDGTSRLSPHLAFGELSSSRTWIELGDPDGAGYKALTRQLLWREFALHLQTGYPHMVDTPIELRYQRMSWRDSPEDFEAWKNGATGYPMVDAALRQLREEGWVHNRARMIAGSFLVKHLLLPWQSGEEWYWENLVDADAASNAMNWQWVAGCGADAAPFFRIFNPVLQGARFDPEGNYVRRWIPELRELPKRWIHRPWEAPADVLVDASVRLGRDYPKPIVDHQWARERALTAYRQAAISCAQDRA